MKEQIILQRLRRAAANRGFRLVKTGKSYRMSHVKKNGFCDCHWCRSEKPLTLGGVVTAVGLRASTFAGQVREWIDDHPQQAMELFMSDFGMYHLDMAKRVGVQESESVH